MSAEHKRYVKKLKIRHAVIWVLRIGLLAAFLGIWELVAHYRIVDPFIISSPSRIVRLIGELYRECLQYLIQNVFTSYQCLSTI